MKYTTVKKIELRARRVRVAESPELYSTAIHGPPEVLEAARTVLDGEDQEVFLVFILDVKNKVLGYMEVARGAVDGCPVDPRAVFRAAVMMGASGVILCHCHPSGDPEYSGEDVVLTKRLVDAGKLLGITVLDHVIVGHGTMVSMAERGMLR